MSFTAEDHVTEIELVGRYVDCTPASVLETVRLALPEGRSIPVNMAEVDRLRAASGVPRTGGATLGQCAEGAEMLYGLTDDDYTLTRDWLTIASLLEDPEVVMAVTGRMGAFPATVHRWDTYTGPHCVAKHDVRTMCDPLAPHGTYIGEQVNLSGWRAFFVGLAGAQAFVMRMAGEPMLQLPEGLTSPQVVKIVTATDLLDAPDGKRIAAAPANRTYPYLGTVPGYKAVSVRTDKPYPDGKERPTQLFVKADHVVVTAAPSAPVAHTVTVLVDGATKASFTLA